MIGNNNINKIGSREVFDFYMEMSEGVSLLRTAQPLLTGWIITGEINSFRVSGELSLGLKFRARSDRQHELCNNLTFWWYSGLCFKITNLAKMSRLQKSMQNYPACKYVN